MRGMADADKYRAIGDDLVRRGKVAAFIVTGGQDNVQAVVGQVLPGTAQAVSAKLTSTTGTIKECEPRRMTAPSNRKAGSIDSASRAGAR